MSAAAASRSASELKLLAGPSLFAAGARRNRFIVWTKFRRNRLASVSAVVVLLLILLAIFAPWIAPHDPLYIDMDHKFARPGEAKFLLGADELGRDVLSRLLHAGRVSLSVGLMTALITVLVGSLLGALAGYYGGVVDAVIMRLVDVLLSMPTIFLLLALAAFLKPTVFTITLIIGLNSWMTVARLVRGQILSIQQQEFILAARAMGANDRHLIFRQLLPNALAPVLVAATLNVATAILLESSLSYLGYGIQPPTASWGNMLNNAQTYVFYAPWVAIYPGIMITVTVLSFNFAGDGLRDALDPRLSLS
ncbi:MAG TPA: ABC transporter permease [Candidatus Methylomirabilis sp.]|nr:ABC transporter permease [Candidatus Methylomirabilis sp.]